MRLDKIDAFLLQPPPGDISGPYPALPYLKAYAQEKGHHCLVFDLGIDALNFFVNDFQKGSFLKKIKNRIAVYEKKVFLRYEERQHLKMLYMSLGFALNSSLIKEAVSIFQKNESFYVYSSYKKAMRILNSFYRTISALHYPTVLTPSHYPSATELKTKTNLFSHCREELNPYIKYYVELLFPQIAEKKPRVIGISMVFGNQSVQALVLGKLIKKRFPRIHVTMGGAYLSQWITVMEKPQLESLFTCTDSVICGEGEIAFSKLLELTSKKEKLEQVPNIIYWDTMSESVSRFPQLEYPDISDLPAPDFDDLNLTAYLTPQIIIPYCISRGCYWGKCVFCQNRYGDQGVRRYQTIPIEKAVKDLERLSEKYNSNHFNFNNDVIDPAYLKRLCKALIASRKVFVWNTDLRAERVFTADRCRELHKAGLNSVAIGFESGCQKTLDKMDKGCEVSTVKKVLRNVYQAGIATHVMGIFGFPGESKADAEKTILFLESNRKYISYYVVGLLMVLPGSRMYLEPKSFGISEISYKGNMLKTPEPVWTSRDRISREQVIYLYERLGRLEEFYAINEYPYVGGLATNHGFLYFQRFGPGVLKKIRASEQNLQKKYMQILGLDQKKRSSENSGSTILQYDYPFVLIRSAHLLDFSASEIPNSGRGYRLEIPERNYYLVDVVNQPLQVGRLEINLLKEINKKKNLVSILKNVSPRDKKRAIYFIFYLLTSGLVIVSDIIDHTPPISNFNISKYQYSITRGK